MCSQTTGMGLSHSFRQTIHSFTYNFSTSSYLPEVLRDVVLQLALHQVAKQRLDLVEDTFFRLISVILDGQEGLK